MHSSKARRTRRLAFPVLLAALILPIAQARAAADSCCKARSARCHAQQGPAPCESLSKLPCCHAAPASHGPATPQHDGGQMAQADLLRRALEAPARAPVGPSPVGEQLARSAALRLSVVLRI